MTGRAEVVERESEAHEFADLEFGPWNPGPKQHWVRLRGTITGRRLFHA